MNFDFRLNSTEKVFFSYFFVEFDFFVIMVIHFLTNQAISCAVGFRQSKTALFDWTFFDWILLVLLLIVSRSVDFIVFALFL